MSDVEYIGESRAERLYKHSQYEPYAVLIDIKWTTARPNAV